MALQVDQIIEQAHNLAEHRVDQTKLDLRIEFFLAIQELLHENRFWWAERTARFTTVYNTAVYDLSSASLANRDDVEEVILVYNVVNSANPAELTPILDRAEQMAALEAATPAPPSTWMVDLGNWPSLRLGAPADGAYPLRILYHAGLNVSAAMSDTTVPIVPGPLHYGLVTALKRRIFDFLYGQNDPRFITANAEYMKFVKDAARKSSFSAQRMNTFESGTAIRAHS